MQSLRSAGLLGMGQGDVLSENLSSDSFDNLSRSVRDVEQGSYHRPFLDSRRSLIENYVESHFGIHFHLTGSKRWSTTNKDGFHNFCIVLECPASADVLGNSARIDDWWKVELKCLKRAAGQMDTAVLVDVGQFYEMKQRALNVLPCRERLECFDKVCSLPPNTFEHWEAVSLKFGDIEETGELGLLPFAGCSSFVENKQFVHTVVESTTEVVDDFSNLDAPYWITLFMDNHANCKLGNGLSDGIPGSIVFGVNMTRRFVGVTVQEGLELDLERVELFASPLNFKRDAGQIRKRHV
jgi:hypothetical protein